MYSHAHRLAQRRINHLMALHEALALKHRAYDSGFEMIAAAGGIADFHASSRDSRGNQTLNFVRIHSDVLSVYLIGSVRIKSIGLTN